MFNEYQVYVSKVETWDMTVLGLAAAAGLEAAVWLLLSYGKGTEPRLDLRSVQIQHHNRNYHGMVLMEY